ncbi:carboxypeptidase B-like [Pectinophora gossypiella]|uniref:carboxypeptidase B-like n=1 Tax=Pectinophora gossypiella TaxID=13191 RepID=UPI00214E1F9C|nr:carboxypeptidase B-like [Pectinophora gossypiella]
MEILVEGTRSMQVQKLLGDRDITFAVTGNDNGPMVVPRSRSPRYKSIENSAAGYKSWRNKDRVMDWKDYYPLGMIYNWMDEIERQFPATCTVCPIGKSVEGRYIKMLKISNSDASNTGVWMDGCIHAREWISTSVVTYIADYIAKNFSKLPNYITNKDWFFVPVVNPDGYHHTHAVDRMWRKSRARFGNTIVGVDLNRNFGYNWGQCGVDAIPLGDPNHQNYRGLEPFSEPETSAIKNLILYSGTPFKIFLTFHAYSEVISFPWCFTSDPCPDYVNLIEGGATMAKAMYDTTGRMYKVGNFKDIMYFASGTSIDWSYGTAKIPFSYLVELRSKEHRFQLPREEILDCCKETLAGVLALAEFVEKKKCLNCTIFASKLR